MRSPSLILWAKKSFEASEIVPKRYKRDSKKETEGASKFCHQGGAWIDQFFGLHIGVEGDGPKRKYEVVGLVS